MPTPDGKSLFLTLADEAFEKEKKTVAACREHAKSCWICRWRVLVGWFIDCPVVVPLLRAAMEAKRAADGFRLGVDILKQQGVSIDVDVDWQERQQSTPSLDWLENLYRL